MQVESKRVLSDFWTDFSSCPIRVSLTEVSFVFVRSGFFMLRRNQAETMRFFLALDPATLEKMEKLGNFTRKPNWSKWVSTKLVWPKLSISPAHDDMQPGYYFMVSIGSAQKWWAVLLVRLSKLRRCITLAGTNKATCARSRGSFSANNWFSDQFNALLYAVRFACMMDSLSGDKGKRFPKKIHTYQCCFWIFGLAYHYGIP